MSTFDVAGASVLDRPNTVTPDSLSTNSGVTRIRRDTHFVQLHDELWRVTRADGDVLGYVESFMDPRGPRFRAKRLIALQKRFITLGDFWDFDDAVDCLRFG